MTENTPAAAEQALPTRRARRAAQTPAGNGAAAQDVREPFPEPAAELKAGPDAVPPVESAAAEDEPPTRRRARAELRSWGSVAAGSDGSGDNVPQGHPQALLIEERPVEPGAPEIPEKSEEPAVPEEPEVPEAPEEPAAASPETEPEPAPEAAWELPAQADDPAEQAGIPSVPETGGTGDGGQRLAVVLPEPPEAPPARQVQEISGQSGDEPLPQGEPESEADVEAEAEAEAEAETVTVPVSAPAPPAGLPLEPMPTELRERTRLAVRGEPNDVRRATFLDTQTARIPASRGFRGFLASLGIRIAPSARELQERRDTRTVSQHWPGPRTISVVNGKGGANKTPTTVMLAAIFARNGGGPVLAWDNNETRGTLGWRTEQAQHDATVMDLLPETGLLLSPAAQSAMLARFVHHQTDDKYDVLRSNPNVLASEQKVTKADFDALHSVASKYFRLNIVDSGNDESAERWLRMIDHTDQLVIASTTVEEHAEAGALLLEALQERGGRYAELARGAVVIVSQADRNGTEAQARRVAEAFKVLARAAVTIPYDPALVKGQIRYDSLRPATQRAWLKAAAAVAAGL